jgi:hypothetical protein
MNIAHWAKQCLQWAHEAIEDDLCRAYLDLERQWLAAASKLDGLPPVRSPSRTQTLNHRVSRTLLADEVIE